jgi:hypothetical protein
MTAELRQQVRERANHCCEYCGLAEAASVLPFHIEHVIPKQHRGETITENLALSCPSCNLHKGPNLTGIDPDSGIICHLFHPRRDLWSEHFNVHGAHIVGISPVGRTTI